VRAGREATVEGSLLRRPSTLFITAHRVAHKREHTESVNVRTKRHREGGCRESKTNAWDGKKSRHTKKSHRVRWQMGKPERKETPRETYLKKVRSRDNAENGQHTRMKRTVEVYAKRKAKSTRKSVGRRVGGSADGSPRPQK